MQNDIGFILFNQGQIDEAIEYYRKAIHINPVTPTAKQPGHRPRCQRWPDEAIENYFKALQIDPNNLDALNNLGITFETAKGQFDKAIEYYRQALQGNPDYAKVLINLGTTLAAKGQLDKAIENYRHALRVNPNSAETHFRLGMTLDEAGRPREATVEYREALRLDSNHAGALNNLAWILAASPFDDLRNGAEAVSLAEQACDLTHYGKPMFIGTLADAYAEAGRFPEAVATAEKAEQLATEAGLTAVAAKNRQLLELYRAGKPYHESLAQPKP